MTARNFSFAGKSVTFPGTGRALEPEGSSQQSCKKAARSENRADVDIDDDDVSNVDDDKDCDASDQTNKKIGIEKQTTPSGFEIF